MIQHQIKPAHAVRPCDCGKPPRFIESTGNRLVTWHFECAPCGQCTVPSTSPGAATKRWQERQLFPLEQIRNLRPQPPQISARKPAAPVLVTRLARAG